MWLDERRGHLVDWATQRWVQLTGRRISLADHQWLDGPAAEPTGVGPEFFETYARARGLALVRGKPAGLLRDFTCLAGPRFEARSISPAVAEFYERTSEFDVDAWAQWCGLFRPFGWLLAVLFSRRLQQLNVPLSGLDTSRGMSSDVLPVVGTSDHVMFTAWVRTLRGSGRVIYAGAYSTCEVPGFAGRCVRVVFPLPNGNAVVIMRPVANADGSLSLISAGDGFGSPGFYFTVRVEDRVVWARYVKSLRESIRVYQDTDGVRADHRLTIWGATFLRIHYRLQRQPIARG